MEIFEKKISKNKKSRNFFKKRQLILELKNVGEICEEKKLRANLKKKNYREIYKITASLWI